MRTFLIVLFTIFATHVGAAETVMVCNADNYEKRYYKLITPIFGDSSVDQKIDGKWVNWCTTNCKKLEVYKSGAMQLTQRMKQYEKSYPDQEIVANQKYFVEIQYWLDFEFATRRTKVSVYKDKTKREELTKHSSRGEDTYSCEVQGNSGYFKKFKGTIEGVFE